MRHRFDGAGRRRMTSSTRPCRQKATDSRPFGTPAWSPAIPWLPWRRLAAPPRGSNWAPRCSRPIRAIRCSRHNRAASVVDAMGRQGFTLGIGPSHEPLIEGMYGLSYAHPGRNTEEYVRILVAALRGGPQSISTAKTGVHMLQHRSIHLATRFRCLFPRWVRACFGWPARLPTGRSYGWRRPELSSPISHRRSMPRRSRLGRSDPRIVAGLPVAVHDDTSEARAVAAARSGVYAGMANYQRILRIGGVSTPAEAAIVGSEASVRANCSLSSMPVPPTSGPPSSLSVKTNRARSSGRPIC